ncbi:Mediator complex subunit Med18 [Cordyceps fumosorosea ARSEF 2679]|uniref:Mediator of RNA polymerase II transcription subunit 18 n=1 Tax=Cordyceps fumosorosea (strain ARSEF 2679) TaxID=1081104 RepID=A0A167VYZ5_CORFA|nr:Mediator complex subunit Med18 [Cordyceps fumosorosea ARSEF 2679]OAA63135.1 Mediator complex subunit Med18 [Cordyceps fumosorosea ARSEF 2679]
MYEVCMTSMVEDADLVPACSILEGLCSMKAWESIVRVLYYQGPSRPAGLSNQRSIEKAIRKNVAPLWRELHQNLTRQAFVVQARYDVLKDRDFGSEPTQPPLDTNATPGILRWTDFPDPPHGKPLLTQRKIVELWEQRSLPSILEDNHHRFKGEVIEETYRFFRDEVEFCLCKQYIFNRIQRFAPLEQREGFLSLPATHLPAWDSLTPVDVQGRWILQVKTHVLQDNKPDEIRKAQDVLMALRNELDGVFDFRPIDRKVYDTRVAMRQQAVHTLPQKVTVGKN